ncbi:hypothetical protein [Paenibacillus zanthoxyli]|uniref:hypothetical protein n=1 Tax=Paenibacillus zanthoxyli TaxID=369399 RepID=UPI000472400D
MQSHNSARAAAGAVRKHFLAYAFQKRVVIAIGKLIGEGFDDARLDTLFLVHPISWSDTLQQYAGRLHRSHVNKEEVPFLNSKEKDS